MGKYGNEEYLRSEHLLKDSSYRSFELIVEDVLEGCPLQRKLKSVSGIALKFRGANRVLGLGPTNASLMAVVAGDADPEKWIGKKVRLEVRKVRKAQGGGTQPAIRIIPPPGAEIRSGLLKELGEAYTTCRGSQEATQADTQESV